MRLTRYLTNAQRWNDESYRKNEDSEGNSYTLIQGQVVGTIPKAVMVVSTLKAARKRTGKTRSNLHTGLNIFLTEPVLNTFECHHCIMHIYT